MLTKLAATVVTVLIAIAMLSRASDPPVSSSTSDRLARASGSAQGPGGAANQADDATLSDTSIAGEPFDPLPFVSGALLASLAGREQDAEALMRHALRLDPRGTAARSWLFNLYLREERFVEAVDEAAILFRLEPSLEPPLSRTLAILSQLADVRAIVIKRFSNTPYIGAIIGSIPPGQLEERALFELAAAAEPRARVDVQSRILADLLGRQDYAATSRALRTFRHSSGPGESLVHDGSFKGKVGPQPFSWTLNANADVRAEAKPVSLAGSPFALHVERFSAASVVAARQSILVKAGKYRLSHLLKAGEQARQADTAAAFTWTITCPALAKTSLASLPIEAATSRWITASWVFEVPTTCNLIELALTSTATDFQREADLMLTRVRLDPIGR